MSEIVEKLKRVSIRHLNLMLEAVLDEIIDDSSDSDSYSDTDIDIALPIRMYKDDILVAFTENLGNYFDALAGRRVPRAERKVNFETLSLVQNEDLEVMVAVEGMVVTARNLQLANFISFNTRLNSLIEERRIDESSNPLDPAQVSTAFKDAIQSAELDPKESLAIYRKFNTGVLKNLGEVVSEANKLLVDFGVIPDLRLDGGKKPRPAARLTPRPQPRDDPAGRAFGTADEVPLEPDEENPALFAMMRDLLHPAPAIPAGPAPRAREQPGQVPLAPAQQYAVPASLLAADQRQPGPMQAFVPAKGQHVQMVDQNKLMEVLTNIQKALEERPTYRGEEDTAGNEKLDISSTLGEMLQDGQADGVVTAVDRQSSDVINLVTLLYEAIWEDDSLPIPIKELIGRTQITIIKVALSDTTFFNKENHPARTVLNDFAEAGIAWTEVEDLQEDPLYKKIEELVHRILADYNGKDSFFEDIVKEFRAFRARQAAKSRVLEQRIIRARERQERLADINLLVTEKINERRLGRDLDSFVKEILERPFHKFMVMLVLKEGPGTNAWKQAINTIDVLLWTVQPHEQSSDKARLEAVNPRLLNNLRKAFRIAQVPADEIDALIGRLMEVQDSTFSNAAPTPLRLVEPDQQDEEAAVPTAVQPSRPESQEPEEVTLADDDPHVQQVDRFQVGVWVEFAGDEDVAIRCKLAAKINAIDKYIFVNRQGVKVIEKTRMGLAREIRDGTVKIISDGLLFSRALESVIGNLREAQLREQTGGAYRPDASQPA